MELRVCVCMYSVFFVFFFFPTTQYEGTGIVWFIVPHTQGHTIVKLALLENE